MKKRLWNKRIPTGFAFLLLFLSIGLTTYFIQQRTSLTGQASPEKQPQNVVISNVTDNSFTVNFTTTTPSSTAVSVEGGGNPSFITYDSGSSGETQKSSLSHFIKISNLSPSTSYKFTILSDGETYLLNGVPYSIVTGPKLPESNLNQSPINGSVLLSEGGGASDTIVVLSVADGQTLSTQTSKDGSFAIPTDSLRTTALNNYLKLEPNDKLTIKAFRADLQTKVEVLVKNSTDIPPITLSQNYNFTSTSSTGIATSASQLKLPSYTSTGTRVTITTPSKNQSFIDTRPRFTGEAIPNENVKVTINPGTTDETVSNSSGIWSYRPTSALLPGNYTLTIQTVDQFGIIKTVAQTFTIFTSGSQLNPAATQSATPTIKVSPTKAPTATPTRTPTPTIGVTPGSTATPIQTATPTILPSATPTIVIPTATLAPSPTSIAIATTQPTPQPTIPPTGNGATTVVLTTISLLLIFAGSALLFLL